MGRRAPQMICAVHSDHRPRCQSFVSVPIGPHPAPSVISCPTGAMNITSLLDAYRREGGTPPWEVRRKFHPAERELARLSWAARVVRRWA